MCNGSLRNLNLETTENIDDFITNFPGRPRTVLFPNKNKNGEKNTEDLEQNLCIASSLHL